MNTHSVFANRTRSMKSAALATLCTGALALSACGGGHGSGMATFCKRVQTLGNTVTAAQNMPDYKDLSLNQTKALISQAHDVASSAPKEINEAATALSDQIQLAAQDGSEDDVKLQSAGDALDAYTSGHCTGAVKVVSATSTTSTTVDSSATSYGSSSDSSYGNTSDSTYGDSTTCTTDDTGYCASDGGSTTVTTNDSSSCIRDSAGNCDPSNGFNQINQVP